MNPLLLAALINEFAIPELTAWLRSRKGESLTDADILAKLEMDAAAGVKLGEAWLVAHPEV